MIDRQTIDRIFSVANIVEVISEFVTLKKAGANYKGLCPFHNERTPSFSVSPARNIFKCFSCGKAGSVVTFIMEHENMTYPEALRWLANKYGITIEEKDLSPEEKLEQSERESMFIVNEWANAYFQDTLYNTPEGQSIGLTYFRNREFRDDIIKKFQLGYCLEKGDDMSLQAINKGYNKKFLTAMGLSYEQQDDKLRDKYHGRVMFPVHTLSGKIVAFGGRIIKKNDNVGKYINSNESLIYNKSKELYGLYFAKQSIVKNDRCFLVEGYTDVISMHQAGIENVVASSGTSLTTGQIRLLRRFTNNITILYDGDSAGIKASLRGIDMLLSEGMNIKVLLLPDGDDPDSFARKNTAEDYITYIDNNQQDFIRFKCKLMMEDCKDDPIKKASLITNIVTSISVIPAAITRSIYVQECSRLLNIKETILTTEIAKQRKKYIEEQQKAKLNEQNATNNQPTINKEVTENPSSTTDSEQFTNNSISTTSTQRQRIEGLIIQSIIKYGNISLGKFETEDGDIKDINVIDYIKLEFSADDISFQTPNYQQIFEEACNINNNKEFKSDQYFLKHPNLAIANLTATMISSNQQLSEQFAKEKGITSTEKRLNIIIPQLIIELKLCIVTEQVNELYKKISDIEISNNPQKLQQLLKDYKTLKDIEHQLSTQAGSSPVNF